jgi:hypothetical protein
MRNQLVRVALVVSSVVLACAGCATYTAPGRGADLASMRDAPAGQLVDAAVVPRWRAEPAASFPVTLAVARIQAPGYRSRTTRSVGDGAFSVVTVRDVETDDDIRRIGALSSVDGVVTMSRLLVPSDLRSDADLRVAAADLHADMLLLYTFDTVFNVADKLSPLSTVTLGLFPTKAAHVTSTASAIIVDSRTGYVYASAESTAHEDQAANAWTSGNAVDESRRRAERRALDGLVERIEATWPGVVARHAPDA